jgi:hypothetical protein
MTKQLTRNCLLVSIVLLLLVPFATFSQEPAPPKEKKKTHLRVEVTGEEAEAVSGADVFVKSEDEDTPFDRTLETDRHGVVNFARVQRVKILIQVTAAGFKTFGDHYELTQESQTIAIKLEKKQDGGR